MNIRKQLDELQTKPLQQLLKETQILVKEWKPETPEGKKYQHELEQIVAQYCPKGSKWNTETKECEGQSSDEEKVLSLVGALAGDDE